MKVAVPLHDNDVAPRFCSSKEFLIAEVGQAGVSTLYKIRFDEDIWSRLLQRLSLAGVKVLLCGGFNRDYQPLAKGLGIQVLSGFAGDANRLIEAFLCNELEKYRFIPQGKSRGKHLNGHKTCRDQGKE